MKSLLLAIALGSILSGGTGNTQVANASTDLPQTFVPAGLAIGIENHSDNDVHYFYSDKKSNGQASGYPVIVGSKCHRSGNGGGSDGKTGHSIEFQGISTKTHKLFYMVIVYSGCSYSRQSDRQSGIYKASLHVYMHEDIVMQNPEGNSNIGTEKDYPAKSGDGANFHMELGFTNAGILINGNPMANDNGVNLFNY